MRIIAGDWRGKKLHPLKDEEIRPTGDRAKSSLFNILSNSPKYVPWPIKNSTVLDVFSGTGSIGLECLSRGAKNIFFIENNLDSLTLLRRNIRLLGAEKYTTVLQKDATNPGTALTQANLVFLDPPYETNLAERALDVFISTGWISAKALVVVETSAHKQLGAPKKLEKLDFRRVGSTAFWFLTSVTAKSKHLPATK